MTSRDFCFWLQGYFEISGASEMNVDEIREVRKHLAMVFKHEIDPSHGDQATQDALNAIHDANTNVQGNSGSSHLSHTSIRC